MIGEFQAKLHSRLLYDDNNPPSGNEAKRMHCVAIPWDLDTPNETLTIDLDPSQTTDIDNAKVGLAEISFAYFIADVTSAYVEVNDLDSSSLIKGKAVFEGPLCFIPPHNDGRRHMPDADSEVVISKVTAFTTKGTAYFYGYPDSQ